VTQHDSECNVIGMNLTARMFLPIADVHAISFRLLDESEGCGGALIANTEVDVSVLDGPTAFVTVVRMIEADVG